MPMYSMYCKKCNKYLEVVTPVADRDKAIRCPHCEEILKRLLDAPRRINIH